MGKWFKEEPAWSYKPFPKASETLPLDSARAKFNSGNIDLNTVESIIVHGDKGDVTLTDKNEIRKYLGGK